jgi:hypothetical protein
MEERILEINETEIPLLRGYDRIYVTTDLLAIDKKMIIEKYLPYVARYGALFVVSKQPLAGYTELKTKRYLNDHVYLITINKKNAATFIALAVVFGIIALILYVLIIPDVVIIPMFFLSLWNYVPMTEALILAFIWPYTLVYWLLFNSYPGTLKHFG